MMNSTTAKSLDFAPDLLAIQERPPERLPRLILIVVAALVALLLLWAIFGKLDVIASADGRLVPKTSLKVVQPAESGIVQEILVKEGDTVTSGQPLIRLNPSLAQADMGTLKNDLMLRQLTLRRIDAELSGQPFTAKPGDAARLYAEVLAQYGAKRRAYQDALAQETELLNKSRQDLAGANQILKKLKDTLPIIAEQAAAQQNLAKSGFVSELAAKDKVREQLEKEQDLKAQESTVLSLASVIAQSERKVMSLKSTYDSQLQTERVQVSSELAKLEQDMGRQTYRNGLLELKAPAAGIVKDLAITSLGSVVAPGAVLLTIVPGGEPLLAEVQIRNEDAGFVVAGQSVKLKLAAYPFQKYGMLDGTVLQISADSNQGGGSEPGQSRTSNAAAGQPLTYKALVQLDAQQLKSPASGLSQKLTPGMQLSAEIHQGRRTVFEYLTSPVQRVALEAGRER